MDEIRKSIEELIARYTVAPELAELDVYVEGSFDVDLVKAFLREARIKDIVPYAINTIDVPDTLLTELGLTSGNRQRVIALATKLGAQIKEKKGIVFIADLDEEQLIGIKHANDRLFYTDDTAMELYVIDERSVERIVQDFAGIHGLSGQDTIAMLGPIAQELFLSRAAAKVLDWPIDWIELDKGKYISISSHTIKFSHEKYIQNCLNNSGFRKREGEFQSVVQDLRKIASTKVERCFRGHDFAKLLLAFLRKNGCKAIKNGQLNEEAILRSLLSIKVMSDLEQTQLFSSLRTCWEVRSCSI
jgi:hypothetical protein